MKYVPIVAEWKLAKIMSLIEFDINDELDVDPQRDDNASPMSTDRCMLRPTWMLI